ncbi:MAG: stage II sporulation protein P [Oscillospiraceae bacterium]
MGGSSHNNRGYKKFIVSLFLVLSISLTFPTLKSISLKSYPLLIDLTKNIAVLSAVTNMPQLVDSFIKSKLSLLDFKPKADSSTSTLNEPKKIQIDIPEEYKKDIIEEVFTASASPKNIRYKNAIISNSTEITSEQVLDILEKPWDNEIKQEKDQPLVLIYHTHATESFEPYDSDFYDTRNTWRSVDNNNNITLVGDKICEVLEKNGINVIHDKTQHDYPSYNSSYNRSEDTVKKYLEKYPSIKIALDIHRDAIQRGDTLVKPVTTIDGKKVAQVMIIAGCENENNNLPNWRENLKFAVKLQDNLYSQYGDIARPIMFCYRKYNQHLTNGSLLLEVGSHGNTLEEAVATGEYIGESLSQLILEELKINEKDG